MKAAGMAWAAALVVATRAAQTIDPRYAVNLTLFHQDRKSAGSGIEDRNTGDENGDAYFTLKDAALPVECAEDPKSFDCTNPEANDADLVVSKLVVEVDSRWGVYGLCNVDNTTGQYFCRCDFGDAAAPSGTPANPTRCVSAMLSACSAARASDAADCDVCLVKNQAALDAAGCTRALEFRFCAGRSAADVASPDTTWTCSVCGHVYDPAKDGNGLPFEQLPDTWKCPVCGAPKSAYKPSVTADGRTVWVHEDVADDRAVAKAAVGTTPSCASALTAQCGRVKGDGRFCEYCEERSYRQLEAAGCTQNDLYTFCFGDKPSCNASVGRIAAKDNMSARRVPVPGVSRDFEFWNYNLAQKMQGYWYSTITTGECNATGTGPCYWRVIDTIKVVSANCQRRWVYSQVEKAGQPCFSKCTNPTNNQTACWVDCFYDTVLGVGSSGKVTDPSDGMQSSALVKAWTAAFDSTDPTVGGCPAL